MDFSTIARQCAPDVHLNTMQSIVHVESSFNPYAIGVVNGHLVRQPTNKAEAIATVKVLENSGFNYSMGLAQVNKYNLGKYGLDLDTVFEPCANVHAGGEILKDCFKRASDKKANQQEALRDAISCYYSGNFTTGYKAGYVMKVVSASGAKPIQVINNQLKKGVATKTNKPNNEIAKTTPELNKIDNQPQESTALIF